MPQPLEQQQFAPLPGDIGLTPGMPPVRWAQTAPGEEHTFMGHVFGFVDDEHTLEALWRVVVKPWANRTGPCEVWRNRKLDDSERKAAAAKARTYEGKKYGWWKIGAHFFDWGLAWALYGLTLGHRKGELYAVRRLLSIDSRPICPWPWTSAYRSIGVYMGVPEGAGTPDELHDWFRQSPDWQCVYRREA